MDEVNTRLTDMDSGLYEADEYAWIETKADEQAVSANPPLDVRQLLAFNPTRR